MHAKMPCTTWPVIYTLCTFQYMLGDDAYMFPFEFEYDAEINIWKTRPPSL